jgi:CDP-glycerol glycerophosphotransferase (TagB/SpsB family)
MVFSGMLLKFPYWLYWNILRRLNRLDDLILYVESEHDYSVVEYILPHLKSGYKIAAANSCLTNTLRKQGLTVISWPCFPRTVIMARHAFHRFPIKGVKKIGLRHGPYHFKKMIHPDKYNAFDLYLFTSEHEARLASKMGIKSGVAGGYPRLDTFRNQKIIDQSILLTRQMGFDTNKKTLLFTATWDKSGLSAIDRWIDHLTELKDHYNIVVSLHPMMSDKYIQQVYSTPGIFIAEPRQLYAYMMLTDILISDTSSIIAEFCALDKPVITFKVDPGPRLTTEIQDMIRDISIQINTIDDLQDAIIQYTLQPDFKSKERAHWNELIYDDTTISHGKRAAAYINYFI